MVSDNETSGTTNIRKYALTDSDQTLSSELIVLIYMATLLNGCISHLCTEIVDTEIAFMEFGNNTIIIACATCCRPNDGQYK